MSLLNFLVLYQTCLSGQLCGLSLSCSVAYSTHCGLLASELIEFSHLDQTYMSGQFSGLSLSILNALLITRRGVG